jgi:hypothetical protein
MPVLRQHHVAEPRGQCIDQRHDLVAARNGEASLGTEVVLHVDNQEDVVVADRKLLSHGGTLSCGARRLSTSVARCVSASAIRTG